MSDKMTKRELNATITEANAVLAWAREFVRDGDMASAANQARVAQVTCAALAVRCERYADERVAAMRER